MAQGNVKKGKGTSIVRSKSAGKLLKERQNKAAKTKKGAPLQLPKNTFRASAIEDRLLSKAIDKASEQKVASKLIQGGGRTKLNDIMQKGKDLNREEKRSQVKKKVGRVEEKLKALQTKAEREGLA